MAGYSWTGQGQDRTGPDRDRDRDRGRDRDETGQGQDRTGQDRTGQDRDRQGQTGRKTETGKGKGPDALGGSLGGHIKSRSQTGTLGGASRRHFCRRTTATLAGSLGGALAVH